MHKRVKPGFTLIELLVVVAIILILAGLLFPAMQYAKEVAKKTRAKGDVKQLEVAFKAVQNDFRGWSTLGPSVSGRAVDLAVVQFLRGANSRGVLYMEFDAGATNSAGSFVDPWFNATTAPNNIYWVAMGDQGTITYGGTTVYREFGAWSKGKDGLDGTAAQRKDDVTSWQ